MVCVIGKVGPLRRPMIISDRQYERLMKQYNARGSISDAAMKAGMDRKTARRYIKAKQGPRELAAKHDWKTRPDPSQAIWPEAERWLKESPELEAKALFEHLLPEGGDKVDGRALRTFPATGAGLAQASWAGKGGVFPANKDAWAEPVFGLDPRRRAWGDNSRATLSPFARARRLALLELGVGNPLPIRISLVSAVWSAGSVLGFGRVDRRASDRPKV